MYGEEDILGNHAYGRGEDYLVEKAKTGDNREFAVEYLRSSKKVAINTFFEQSNKGKTTYKEMWIPVKDAPYTPERYAELDQCFIKQKWENAITNVEAEHNEYFNSGHFPIIIECKIKLEAQKQTDEKRQTWTGAIPKGDTQEEEEQSKTKSSKEVLLKYKENMNTPSTVLPSITMKQIIKNKIEALTTAMKSAASNHMGPKSEFIRKFEPTQETRQLFDTRQKEKDKGDLGKSEDT